MGRTAARMDRARIVVGLSRRFRDSQRNPKTETGRRRPGGPPVRPAAGAPAPVRAAAYCSSDRTIWLICEDCFSIEVLACIRMLCEVMLAVSRA